MPGSIPQGHAMYAIIEDSGSQYKISAGDVIRIDTREIGEGQKTLTFDKVLLVGGESPKIGAPYVKGAKVTAELVGDDSVKVTIQKFKRRKNYKRKRGHRQNYLKVKITDIAA
jgi:large subunit ribosomal protein L21